MESTIAQEDRAAELSAEIQARRHNAADLWDKLWGEEGDDTWRKQALERVYARVTRIVKSINPVGPHGVSVTDIGGGRGLLAEEIVKDCHLVAQNNRQVDGKCASERTYPNMCVVDHSVKALDAAYDKGFDTVRIDLETADIGRIPKSDLYVSTECFEHLSAYARTQLYEMIGRESVSGAIFSVPNNRLGPDEEPQHTVKFTAMSLKRELQQHFKSVRIEVLGPFLLAVVGKIAEKNFTMSATLPVRDEGRDLEGTLASIRGIADQLVVGVDPRTKDNTWEIAELYADEVFFLERPMGPPDGHSQVHCEACWPDDLAPLDCREFMGEDGINFAWARNQCLAKCTGEWIFMTEGHERLVQGEDLLLSIDQVMPKGARIGFVMRQGDGQQWAFPWLFQNTPDIKFTRPVHNILDYPDGTFCCTLGDVRTLHDRHHDRSAERAKQRTAQNRNALLDDWLVRKSEASLFYLGQEWRNIVPEKAIDRLEQFLVVSNNGVQRYQARLILAKEYMRAGNPKEAIRVLHPCTSDDWSRSEHFVWLGDIAFTAGEFEKAHMFYTYAATTINAPPFTVWWISLEYYGHLPAQRLAMTCGELGRVEEALMWCRKVVELLPHDAPQEAFDEAAANVTLLESALNPDEH